MQQQKLIYIIIKMTEQSQQKPRPVPKYPNAFLFGLVTGAVL